MGIKTRVLTAVVAASIGLAVPIVQKVEGTEYDVYLDIAGIPTVCNGLTGPEIKMGHRYSDAQCKNMLAQRIEQDAIYVDKMVKVEIPLTMRAALISFTFNVGRNAFRTSTLLREVNNGNLKTACGHLYDFVYYTDPKTRKKKKSKGLKNRRDFEYSYCVKDLK